MIGPEVYDIHTSILHLLGIEHEKLTFRHDGVDRRRTDEILAYPFDG